MWSATAHALTPWLLGRWLLFVGWPLHMLFVVTATATLGLALATDQLRVVTALLAFVVHYFFGLWASFMLHELGHVVVLSRTATVTALTLERTALRISLTPHGTIVGRTAFLAAALGPASCIAAGIALVLFAPHLHLHVWYFAHAIFLTPVFNDGRVLVKAARAWRRRLLLAPSGETSHRIVGRGSAARTPPCRAPGGNGWR